MMNSPAGISTILGQSAQSRKMRGVRVASVAGLVVASPDCPSAAATGRVAAREYKAKAKSVIADLTIGPPCRLEYKLRLRRTAEFAKRQDNLAASLSAPSSAAAARKACSVATTCAPSPIAAPTRLVEFDRTSPTANTPRRLVSCGRRPPSRLAPASSAPVSTKPL